MDGTVENSERLFSPLEFEMTIFVRLIGLLLVGGVGVCGEEGYAQSRDPSSWNTESSYAQQRAREAESNVESVPSWAESASQSGRSTRNQNQTSLRGEMSTQDHTTQPGIPVDGGLLYLVLAGVGYAGWRLSGTNYESERGAEL